MNFISYTLDTFQLSSGWLKDVALQNISLMNIRDTFQSLNGWLREVAFLNIALISVTLDTFREVLEPAAGTFAGRPARRVLAPHPARNARELFVLGGGAKYPQQRARGGEYCGLVRPQGSGILLRGSPGALS